MPSRFGSRNRACYIIVQDVRSSLQYVNVQAYLEVEVSKKYVRQVGMSLSLTKFEYSNMVEFSLVTQTWTPEIDLLNESFDMV